MVLISGAAAGGFRSYPLLLPPARGPYRYVAACRSPQTLTRVPSRLPPLPVESTTAI